jgi:hypothetical protein
LRSVGLRLVPPGWLFGCAEESLGDRGSLVEDRSSRSCAGEKSGIEHDAEVASYGSEGHSGGCHELGGGGRGVESYQQIGSGGSYQPAQ